MPHPKVITIQPAFCPLDRFSSTQATTPLPSRIRSAVPITSAPKMLKASSPSSPRVADPTAVTLILRVRRCQTGPRAHSSPNDGRQCRTISANFGLCPPRSSRSSAPPPSSGSCPAATAGWASPRSRASSTCRRAPCTGSCARWPRVGFVEQDVEGGPYQLGAALLHMGSSYLDGNELRTRALNWSDSLASRSGESVRIGTLHETPGAGRAPRLPAGRQPPGARGRRAAPGPRDRAGQGAARVEPLRRGRARRHRAAALHRRAR